MSQTASNQHIIGILPARWGSTRFPGKPLHLIAGKPLIQHAWERCRSSKNLSDVLIATDDIRIADAARKFGGSVIMTSTEHLTGTDRLAEAVDAFPAASHILNIQGDEPLIDPLLIDELAKALIDDSDLQMVTAANPIDSTDPAVNDPHVVKVVLKKNGYALYFSRSPIPYFRCTVAGLPVFRHKGIYGYRRDFLKKFVTWPPSPLEQAESLEQLRALENGTNIRVIITSDTSPGVDTPAQAIDVERLLLNHAQSHCLPDQSFI
ncbi:MAG: 3-deoxy-manno-octulosonate cytidylyltransferase [Armatimonadetes bacterium]|nr:3-deoxy-manno-octulosonate cytidylyltransferase [Akkermansiaceae bacterium]